MIVDAACYEHGQGIPGRVWLQNRQIKLETFDDTLLVVD
jgi:hypothetical protein